MNTLSDAITEFVHQTDKKPVLLIDEVDASSQFSPFLNFLGMLRTKYLARFRPQYATFHSIALAGVHGLAQLADYLDIHGVSQGFLVIFDDRKKKSWRTEAIQHYLATASLTVLPPPPHFSP